MNLEMELNALPKLVIYATRDSIVATCLQITNLNTFWDFALIHSPTLVMARIMATDAAIELDDFSKKRAEKQLLQQQQNEQESSRTSEYDIHDGSVAAWAWTSAALCVD